MSGNLFYVGHTTTHHTTHVNSSLRSMTFNKKGFFTYLSFPENTKQMRSKDSINSGSLELLDDVN